jgi:hypothetical protein
MLSERGDKCKRWEATDNDSVKLKDRRTREEQHEIWFMKVLYVV